VSLLLIQGAATRWNRSLVYGHWLLTIVAFAGKIWPRRERNAASNSFDDALNVTHVVREDALQLAEIRRNTARNREIQH